MVRLQRKLLWWKIQKCCFSCYDFMEGFTTFMRSVKSSCFQCPNPEDFYGLNKMNAVTYLHQWRPLSVVLFEDWVHLEMYRLAASNWYAWNKQYTEVYSIPIHTSVYPIHPILINVTRFMKHTICSVSLVESFSAHLTGFLIYFSFAMILNKINPPMQNKQTNKLLCFCHLFLICMVKRSC